jgi:tetratricopeptide (TPR) repeat protein
VVIAGILAIVFALAAGLWLRKAVLLRRDQQLVRRAIAARHFDLANSAIERWLKSAPDSGEAHYLKAEIAWGRNDLPTVDQELMYARQLGHDEQATDRLRGLLLARGPQSALAERLLRQTFDGSLKPDPEVAEALARLYLGTFQLGEAAAVLDRWMKEMPHDARPILMRTEIDTRNRARPDVLIGLFRDALARDPSLEKARLGLASQLRLNRNHADAAEEYAAYLARKPDDPLAHLGAGQNALEMGDSAQATQFLDRALELAPHDSEVLAGRAELEFRLGRLESALKYFDQAIQADPFDHWNHYQRMLILSRLGQTTEANAERRVVERLKNEQARFTQVSRELLRNPLDAALRSEAALWLMTHGHENEGVEWANLVLRADPAHPAMNRLLADYYRQKGQTGLANFHETRAEPRADQAATP